MPWTSQEAQKFIMSKLGAPYRVVELSQDQLQEALKRSVRQLASVKPIFKYSTFNILSGVQGYNLTTLNKPFGSGITDLWDQPLTSPAGEFNEFEYYRLRQPPYVDMGEMLIDKIYYKEISMLTGTQFDWHWDPDTTTILITPTPIRSRPASYQYNAGANLIEEVRPSDQGWVVDYALAIAKEMLARVRGKFQGVPGNELPVNTDWSELLREGLEKQDALVESLVNNRGSWTPPIKG